MKINGADIIKIMQNGVEVSKCINNGINIYEKYTEPVNNPELVKNGDFSQGATNWTVGSGIWDYSTGSAVVTGASNSSVLLRQWIAIQPNTQYVIVIGTNTGQININGWVGQWNTNLGSLINKVNITGTYTFTTPSNCGYLQLDLTNGSVINTPVTFDNISIKKA